MKSLQDIFNQYTDIDALVSQSINLAFAKKSDKDYNKWLKIRALNDQTYFLILFAQFEEIVNQRYVNLVRRKKNSSTWEKRRAWSLLEYKPEQIAFKKRLSLLIDSSNKEYSEIIDYYKDRNKLAHGSFLSSSIALHSIYLNMAKIAKLLKR